MIFFLATPASRLQADGAVSDTLGTAIGEQHAVGLPVDEIGVPVLDAVAVVTTQLRRLAGSVADGAVLADALHM